jgi:pimeloyl-ACP methyl ester carboxylesterase
MPAASEKKNTNVRAPAGAAPILRAGANALAALSPRLAAAAVVPLFFKAPRRRRTSEEERAVLARGQRRVLGSGADRIVTWSWGDGPVVLLAHGWGGSAAQMTPFVEPLAAQGFRAVALDAPAHGDSPGWTSSIPIFAGAIARVAEAEGGLHGVVAHSMGGAAFSLAAARGLAARRAVYVGPPADAAGWFRDFVRFLAVPPSAARALRARAEAFAGVRLVELNTRHLGPRLQVPLLVIHDRDDREVPLEAGARVAADAGGRLHVTEGLGHRRILKDPAVVAEAVRFVSAASVERP